MHELTRALELVHAVLDGDLGAMDELFDGDFRQLAALPEVQPQVVYRAAVARVIAALRDGRIEPPQAQRWASFVRRGYWALSAGELSPIEIEYDSACEDVIADAIGRLDELGDIIDGTIDRSEAAQLIASLLDCSHRSGSGQTPL